MRSVHRSHWAETKLLVFALLSLVTFTVLACTAQTAKPTAQPRFEADPPGTPTITSSSNPENTGTWDAIIDVSGSQSEGGVTLSILKAAYSTPHKLLPGLSVNDLTYRGLADASFVFAILIEVKNDSDIDIILLPGGPKAQLAIGGEQTSPAPRSSHTGGRILAGSVWQYQVVFPLTRVNPATVTSFTYFFDAYDITVSF